MEFLTSTILSGMLYDGFSKSIRLSSDFLKQKLQNWIIDEQTIEQIVDKLRALNLEDLSERAIEQKINNSDDILKCIQCIKQIQANNSIVQNHSGSGDNIAGNKIIHSGK
ncbi:GapS6a family protein [Arsenophonus nasoniae]|uniref:Uncharacterized protein n=1 Tax=Arsenophonus nasoniae TaxID=638 RepID=A0AA95GH98_9GAMM|nr:hypothetical protein [Arsenophonus nasoniae]WGL96310.1 hypothetical protein QE207_07030 [Arsenophonus nasoniae]